MNNQPYEHMQIQILDYPGEQNATIVDGPDDGNLMGLLENFLKTYQMRPDWKNVPLILVLNEHEESALRALDRLRDASESEDGFRLRILTQVADRVNKAKYLIGGFTAMFVFETANGRGVGARRMGLGFYELPWHTVTVNTNGKPVGNDYFSVGGRIVPPKF